MSGLTFGDMEAEVRRACDAILGPKNPETHRFDQCDLEKPEFKAVTDFAKSMHQIVGAYFPSYRSWFEASAERNILFKLMNMVSAWRDNTNTDSDRMACSIMLAKLRDMESRVGKGVDL